MRTTLDLADDLMRELLRITRAPTKTAAIELAIADFLRRRKIEKLMAVAGKIDFDLDWKALEAEEIRESREAYGRRTRRRR